MRELKDKVRKEIGNKITIDPTMDERYSGKVLFQHKIDRLNDLLKDVKLQLVPAEPKTKF